MKLAPKGVINTSSQMINMHSLWNTALYTCPCGNIITLTFLKLKGCVHSYKLSYWVFNSQL